MAAEFTQLAFMVKVADPNEVGGIPVSPVSSDYECKECGKRWRYVQEAGVLADWELNHGPWGSS